MNLLAVSDSSAGATGSSEVRVSLDENAHRPFVALNEV
jgi:hypothetical protein